MSVNCGECLFRDMYGGDLSSMINSCWSSVDSDLDEVDICLDKGSDSGSWQEMSYWKIDESNGNWGCMEKSEWQIYMEEESNKLIFV